MTSKQTEALKLAREALEYISSHYMSLPKIGCMALAAVEEALAEQPAQQEPPTVAELVCVCGAEWEWRNRDWELVVTPQASKPWVGLTPEEIDTVYRDIPPPVEHWKLSRAIEAKLREKNT